jgi:prepilin-type N-terminal cleavage/methylation domain-containing protein
MTSACPHAHSAVTRLRSRARSECGYTLVELLVVITVLTGILAALLGPLETSQMSATRDQNYAYAQQEARTGLDSIVSQVRQASVVLATTGNSVDFNIYLSGVAYRVYYECDVPQPTTTYRECVRLQVPAGTALPSLGSGSVVVRNLTNGTSVAPVFSFAPDPADPNYMTATVSVPSSDGTANGLAHTITLSNGALMRNQNVGN